MSKLEMTLLTAPFGRSIEKFCNRCQEDSHTVLTSLMALLLWSLGSYLGVCVAFDFRSCSNDFNVKKDTKSMNCIMKQKHNTVCVNCVNINLESNKPTESNFQTNESIV